MNFKTILIGLIIIVAATAATGQVDYQTTSSSQDKAGEYGQDSSSDSMMVPIKDIKKTKDGWVLEIHVSQSLVDSLTDSDAKKGDDKKDGGDDKKKDGDKQQDKDKGQEKEEDKQNEKDKDKQDDKESDSSKDKQKNKDEEKKDEEKQKDKQEDKEKNKDSGKDKNQDDDKQNKDKESDKDKDEEKDSEKDQDKDKDKQTGKEKNKGEEKQENKGKENNEGKQKGKEKQTDKGNQGKQKGHDKANYKGKDKDCYSYKGKHADIYEHWKNGKLHTAEFQFLTPMGEGTAALKYDESCGQQDKDKEQDDDSDEKKDKDEEQDKDEDKQSEDDKNKDGDKDKSPGDSNGDDNSSDDGSSVSEEAAQIEAPEEGDYWFEAEGDGWISYLNPRDEYRSDYVSGASGPGSGKVCTVLLNEAGEPITGETVPNTEVTFPMGDNLNWHPHASPINVKYPLTDNYNRPMDSDQFGTSPDMPQGDGYMDSHCIEFHQMPEDAKIEYSEAEVTGEHADDIEIVGYYDKLNTWDSDVNPLEIASQYGASSSSDGEIQFSPGNTHGEAYVIMQLNR